LHRLEWTESGDSPNIPADFAVYDEAGAFVADLEIAELTDVWEWWRPGTSIYEVDDPWSHISGLLRQKGQKAERYRTPTWLIVYDNASSGIFMELKGLKFGASLAARQAASKWAPPSSVTEMWVLSSDGRVAACVWRRWSNGDVTAAPDSSRAE
jgi:hypothetical protein